MSYAEIYNRLKLWRKRQLDNLDALILMRHAVGKSWDDLKERKIKLLRRIAVRANRILLDRIRRKGELQ